MTVRAVVLAPPFMEKRPLVIVEEALDRKPANVERPETASVPVAVMLVPMMSPATESIFQGLVVPMPTLPAAVILIFSVGVVAGQALV